MLTGNRRMGQGAGWSGAAAQAGCLPVSRSMLFEQDILYMVFLTNLSLLVVVSFCGVG
jgi:hypothetical protein